MYVYPQHKDSDGNWTCDFGYGGLTLRDHFASLALPAIIARIPLMKTQDENRALPGLPLIPETQGDEIKRAVVNLAYDYADLMMARREQ